MKRASADQMTQLTNPAAMLQDPTENAHLGQGDRRPDPGETVGNDDHHEGLGSERGVPFHRVVEIRVELHRPDHVLQHLCSFVRDCRRLPPTCIRRRA